MFENDPLPLCHVDDIGTSLLFPGGCDKHFCCLKSGACFYSAVSDRLASRIDGFLCGREEGLAIVRLGEGLQPNKTL